jgi:hypothetical protein
MSEIPKQEHHIGAPAMLEMGYSFNCASQIIGDLLLRDLLRSPEFSANSA